MQLSVLFFSQCLDFLYVLSGDHLLIILNIYTKPLRLITASEILADLRAMREVVFRRVPVHSAMGPEDDDVSQVRRLSRQNLEWRCALRVPVGETSVKDVG